jgi:hypothetical protein
MAVSNDVFGWLSALPWFAWIAIVAIICSSISGMIHRRYKHLERIEMIRQGMNPDGGKPGVPPEV